MHLISQRDFETKTGQKKIIESIRSLESKVRDLEQNVQVLSERENLLEQDLQGYGAQFKK